VLPNEVVEHEIERQSLTVILDLLAESIRQPREALHLHPHSEVVPLGRRGADVPRIGVAGDFVLACTQAFRWAIFPLMSLAIAARLNDRIEEPSQSIERI
jgi:hypothetical protein